MPDRSTDLSRREFMRASSACAILTPMLSAGAAESAPPSWAELRGIAGDDERLWDAVRRQYFIEDGLNYLNTGTCGPTLRAAYDAACHNLFAMGSNYSKAFRANMMGEAVPTFIARVARFVGAKPDEVAFTSGTTESMNYIANGLDLKPGDEILTTRHEHFGGVYPWLLKAKRYGVVVRQIDLKTPPDSAAQLLEQFERAMTPRTRVVSFCQIQYTDGAVLPVREICGLARSRGIISVVDGAQAIGMLDFRISDLGCDFYAASLHKWLTSPYGCGLLYTRDEMREKLWPTVVLSFGGWNTVDRDGHPGITDITYAPNYPKAVLKYSSNIEYYGSLYWTVALAMDFQDAIGRDRIEARIRTLSTRMADGLRGIPGLEFHSPADPKLRSGLVSFRAPGVKDTEQFAMRLRTERNIVSRYVRHPGMNFDVNRFSTHIFNSPVEVDAAVTAVREIAA